MILTVSNVRLPLGYTGADLNKIAARAAGLRPDEVKNARLVRRSLDARKKNDIHYVANLAFSAAGQSAERALTRPGVAEAKKEAYKPLSLRADPIRGRAVVVGLGPAGLFAALELAKHGFRPLVIERGRPIGQRAADVEAYWKTGELNLDSNVMFGEGGAGTFSDGKLTSRSKDPRSALVLEALHAAGAPDSILYEAKPHIGTDRLRTVVQNIREEIVRWGGEVRFETKLTGIRIADGRLTAAVIEGAGGEEEIETGHLILAIGQGARDTVRMLHKNGVAIEKKPFAVGVRAEHPQSLVNLAQYGDAADNLNLGAAEYRLTAECSGRGVYTFCMCPGGYVVASASGMEQAVVNGMSNFDRGGKNANAAVVVQVRPEDCPKGDLGGIEFCEALEKSAFLAGGGQGKAPAERLGDFIGRRAPRPLGKVEATYRPGVTVADLWKVLPEFVAEGVCEGLKAFSRQLKGYDLDDAVLTAVESRTSAPYRIVRDRDLNSISLRGLLPVGEGAGYAGGIVSSAIDGLRAAEAVLTGKTSDGLGENKAKEGGIVYNS